MIMNCHRISSKGLVMGLEFHFVARWTMLINPATTRRYLTIPIMFSIMIASECAFGRVAGPFVCPPFTISLFHL